MSETSAMIVCEVQTVDEGELILFRDNVDSDAALLKRRALDGDTVVQAVLVISASTLPILKTWLLTRAENKKATTISWGGRRLVGYSAKDAIEIIERLSEQLDVGKQSQVERGDSIETQSSEAE